jgi:hypothetical protein
MTDEQLKTLCISIIAAGIRMNNEAMHKINHIAQEENDHSERIVAMWALTTFDFVEDQIQREKEDFKK